MSQILVPEPMRQAFASRLRAVVDHLAQTADPSTIAEVLATADALSGLSVALERATVTEAAMRDPLAAARTRGIAARERLIEKAGGVLRLGDAAGRLGVSPQAIPAAAPGVPSSPYRCRMGSGSARPASSRTRAWSPA